MLYLRDRIQNRFLHKNYTMKTKYAIGVDIGGSHITCAAMDMETQKILENTRKRASVSHLETTETIFRAWAGAINDCMTTVEGKTVAGIGFAMPGPFNYREGISMMEHKYPNLYKLHIPTELSKYIDSPNALPMRFLNDASSFAVGVSWIGKGKGYRRVIVLTLGTGFGSAYVENELPVVEGQHIAPEGCFWHLPFKEGIADNYFSTGWFVKRYKEATGRDVDGVKIIIDENPEKANLLFEEFGENLAEFMIPWLKKFKAEGVVLGGNISLAYRNFEASFQKALKAANVQVQVEISDLMEDAAIVGSARLLEEDFWKRVSVKLPKI